MNNIVLTAQFSGISDYNVIAKVHLATFPIRCIIEKLANIKKKPCKLSSASARELFQLKGK
jgi:hypothetical protein